MDGCPTPDPFAQCVLYFRLKASTALAMKNLDTASEGVRLWVSYCKHVGLEDDFHGRFKVRLRLLSFLGRSYNINNMVVLLYPFSGTCDVLICCCATQAKVWPLERMYPELYALSCTVSPLIITLCEPGFRKVSVQLY